MGHTLNLDHDGNPSDGEYYLGHGTGDTQWCPIMGWGAWSLNQWDDVDYFAFTTLGGNVQFSINEDVIIGASNLDILQKYMMPAGQCFIPQIR